MKKFLASLILVMLLSSCDNVRTIPTDLPKPPQVPADQLVQCDALDVPDANITWDLGKLYTAYTDLQGQYNECAIRHDCLIAAAHDPEKNKSCPGLDKLKEERSHGIPTKQPTK